MGKKTKPVVSVEKPDDSRQLIERWIRDTGGSIERWALADLLWEAGHVEAGNLMYEWGAWLERHCLGPMYEGDEDYRLVVLNPQHREGRRTAVVVYQHREVSVGGGKFKRLQSWSSGSGPAGRVSPWSSVRGWLESEDGIGREARNAYGLTHAPLPYSISGEDRDH